MLWYQKNKQKTDFEKNHLESERTFFQLYIYVKLLVLLIPTKICTPFSINL